MDNLVIKVYPDQALKMKAEEVTVFDDKLSQTVADLTTAMMRYRALGLSATQVGLKQSILVFNVEGEEGAMINPKIIATEGNMVEDDEGCLSFPGVYVRIKRPYKITVEFQDVEGEKQTRDFEGLAGRCVQHEMDHLIGRTLLFHLSKLKRDMVIRKMTKQQREIAALEKQLNKKVDHAKRAQETLVLPRR